MTIAEAREKCKYAVANIPRDALVITILVITSSASFGLGYFAGKDEGQGSGLTSVSLPPIEMAIGQQVVASKNGTKYYLPDCSGADRITEANKVWFTSPAAASAAGYAPAANCKGL